MSYIIGIDPTKTRTAAQGPEFQLGAQGETYSITDGAKEFIYVKCTLATTGDGYVVAIDASFDSTQTVAATGDAGTGMFKRLGVARGAIPAAGYGWVQIGGKGLIQVAASTPIYTQLNVTATPGQLSTTTGATLNIAVGLVLTTAAGGAAGTALGLISGPFLGAKSA